MLCTKRCRLLGLGAQNDTILRDHESVHPNPWSLFPSNPDAVYWQGKVVRKKVTYNFLRASIPSWNRPSSNRSMVHDPSCMRLLCACDTPWSVEAIRYKPLGGTIYYGAHSLWVSQRRPTKFLNLDPAPLSCGWRIGYPLVGCDVSSCFHIHYYDTSLSCCEIDFDLVEGEFRKIGSWAVVYPRKS